MNLINHLSDKESVTAANAGLKRMFWNHVFCPIVLYTNVYYCLFVLPGTAA